jgi:hypothetical protein
VRECFGFVGEFLDGLIIGFDPLAVHVQDGESRVVAESGLDACEDVVGEE